MFNINISICMYICMYLSLSLSLSLSLLGAGRVRVTGPYLVSFGGPSRKSVRLSFVQTVGSSKTLKRSFATARLGSGGARKDHISTRILLAEHGILWYSMVEYSIFS